MRASAEIYDTTIGWRFVNKRMQDRYGIATMPETAENLAAKYSISRAGPGSVRPLEPGKGRRRPGRWPSGGGNHSRHRSSAQRRSRRS